jgi:hypothetical protein
MPVVSPVSIISFPIRNGSLAFAANRVGDLRNSGKERRQFASRRPPPLGMNACQFCPGEVAITPAQGNLILIPQLAIS